MDSMIEYGLFWLIYFASAIVGLWCWGQCFYWLRQSEAKQFVYALGAVILLTPAPAGEQVSHLAPALIVVPFAWLDSGFDAALPAIRWWLIALGLAVSVLALRALLNFMSRTPQE